MISALAVAETDRLAKPLRLVFSSDKAGEITAAVAAVRRILAAADLDGHWLADHLTAPVALPVKEDIKHTDHADDDTSLAWFCFHRRHQLSPKERLFTESIVRWSTSLSPKQRQWLFDIADRPNGAAA
jgi:hypothetical protein